MAVGVTGGVAPVYTYTSYDVALATVLQLRLAVVCVAMVVAFAGSVLVAQPGTGITTEAVVNTVLLATSQPLAAPLALRGATYQLYTVDGVNPLTLYAVVATLAVGVAGGVNPAHTYTS